MVMALAMVLGMAMAMGVAMAMALIGGTWGFSVAFYSHAPSLPT
jgi:hypothetical protein